MNQVGSWSTSPTPRRPRRCRRSPTPRLGHRLSLLGRRCLRAWPQSLRRRAPRRQGERRRGPVRGLPRLRQGRQRPPGLHRQLRGAGPAPSMRPARRRTTPRHTREDARTARRSRPSTQRSPPREAPRGPLDHAVKVAGIDHVGISSDFDGGGGIGGWDDASETPNVTIELVGRGYHRRGDREALVGQHAASLARSSRLREGEARPGRTRAIPSRPGSPAREIDAVSVRGGSGPEKRIPPDSAVVGSCSARYRDRRCTPAGVVVEHVRPMSGDRSRR